MKTHILCSLPFSRNCAFYEIMWIKYGTAGQATNDNITLAPFMLVTKVTNTHLEYVIFIASTSRIFSRNRLNVSFVRT
jgi:hypothetical protein